MKLKWGRKISNFLARHLDLPDDVMMDLPRITMIGQLHIYIENHRGLLSFEDDEIRLLLKQGQLLVRGKGFVIKTILPEEILVEGKVEQVYYLSET
ncbi:sporulation protein YqfC [Bacillus fonticola]|uniref:sporulation protein YqfC n=1 Tax=Bacillus fonticola TaxID=2728853 RepID=UPI001476204B|nr:sporulation protein YqfC [Bacillus fonticola]